MPNLHVYINQNQLTALPEEIGALKNVAFLYCERKRLRTLPRALLEMDSLIAMYFTENEFTEKPPGSKDPEAIVVLRPTTKKP